jgi:hypothetical protein
MQSSIVSGGNQHSGKTLTKQEGGHPVAQFADNFCQEES